MKRGVEGWSRKESWFMYVLAAWRMLEAES